MSAPTGEVDDVFADVSKLVGDNKTLNEGAINSIFREYNTEHLTPALDTQGKPVLVSKFGQVSDREYLDPSTGRVLKFDHLKRVFTGETEKRQQLDNRVESYRSAIATALQAYIAESYKPNKVVVAVYGADNGMLTICLSARNVNLGNFWTGGWRSIYSVSVSRESGSVSMSASIKINVHYFEDGNVQMHDAFDQKFTVAITGNAETTAANISKAINNFETDFQNNLEEMYVNMHRNTFKYMRRFLPLNKQKFTWALAAHSLAAEVSNH